MKKTTQRKLTLNKETVASLTDGNLVKVAGGVTEQSVCAICSAYGGCDTI